MDGDVVNGKKRATSALSKIGGMGYGIIQPKPRPRLPLCHAGSRIVCDGI